jgi:hypothetical protein
MAQIKQLDGAKVLFKIKNDRSRCFGLVGRRRITALAICQYPDDPSVTYVFACDRHWKVVGDLAFSSVTEAKASALEYYGQADIQWL